VNAGANFGLGDIASIGLGIGAGEGIGIGGLRHTVNDGFWRGGVFLGFNLSDTTSAELGVTYTDHDRGELLTVAGGLYYTPVSQLTIGAEASYTDITVPAVAGEGVAASIITVYRF
jgi:hypothetical protein